MHRARSPSKTDTFGIFFIHVGVICSGFFVDHIPLTIVANYDGTRLWTKSSSMSAYWNNDHLRHLVTRIFKDVNYAH